MVRRLDYKKQIMLKQFRISEDQIQDTEESMMEIDFKQGTSRGLHIVNEEVFGFFLVLNEVVQAQLTNEHFHLHYHNIHMMCRSAVDENGILLEKWIDLFGSIDDNEIEDEVLLTLVMDLYKDVTEHFLKISISQSLKFVKTTVPRKKKQALRAKVTASGEKQGKKPKITKETVEDVDICCVCNTRKAKEKAKEKDGGRERRHKKLFEY
ncbi:Protein amalgam [Mizuhopecten yessoensis]|uniref:Protein amalgam n=1 Tax=Mizuhopecten yessoensis TaxID=6573 RepID=A0A210Q4W1_MIZYE|nr:Protein amalgam [Mizuhopecten yessoensis]